jgi:hypothetical protein
MKKTAAVLALAIAGISGGASADNLRGWYAGGGVSQFDAGATAGGNTILFNTLEGFGGYKYNWYLGGEVRVGTGLTTYETTATEFSVTHFESAYYRMESSNQVAKLYGLLGFSNVAISADPEIAGRSSNESGISYGIGVGFVTGTKTNLNFEYKVLLDTDETNIETLTMNLDYRF